MPISLRLCYEDGLDPPYVQERALLSNTCATLLFEMLDLAGSLVCESSLRKGHDLVAWFSMRCMFEFLWVSGHVVSTLLRSSASVVLATRVLN